MAATRAEPKNKPLSRRRILRAAVRHADKHGMDGLNMRQLTGLMTDRTFKQPFRVPGRECLQKSSRHWRRWLLRGMPEGAIECLGHRTCDSK